MSGVIFKNDVLAYLDELVTTLYGEGYFGFEDSAVDYVNWIYDSIYNDLPTQMHYTSPPELARFGKYYIKLKSNRRTTWYIFFNKSNARFLVRHITNNYSPDSAFLNNL